MARIARLGVVIDSSGAKRGADETTTALRGIEKTAERTVSQLQKAAATLGIAFGVKALQESVDQYTLLDARLKQVTGSGAAYARVQQQLFSIAQASRASFSATVDLYTRLARSSDQLGISQQQLVSVTEAVSNAVRLSGASTGAAEAGLVQLGQAFASGTLRGDELRSIMEQLPGVANAIANGLGVPIGKLREMGEAGELSGRKVALALDSQREKLALLAGEIPTTIGQALQQLNNAFGLVVSGSNEAKSATQGIAGGLGEAARFMVEYKDAVVAVTVALGIGGLTLAAIKAGAAIAATSGGSTLVALASLATGVTSVSGAFAFLQLAASAAWTAITGPIGLAIAGITAVAAAVYFWRTRQKETTEAVKETTKSAQDLYDAAKKLASVNWAPPELIKQIANLGGELRAAQQGGRQSVEVFRAAAEQWKDSGDKARTFAQALAEGDTKAQTLLQTTRAQVQLGAQVERTIDAQAKAQQAAAKATEERKQIEADYQAQVVQLGIELAERARAATEAHAQAIRESDAAFASMITVRTRSNALLQQEVTALAQGTMAAIAFTRQQQLQALIAEGLNEARQREIALTPQVIGAIVGQATQTQKLLQLREALSKWDGKSPFTIPDKDVEKADTLVNSMRDLIGVVQLVAQAFGDVGRSIAEAATGAQSIVSGLQRAGSIKNAKGEGVSLGGALSGNAGASGVLAGIGSIGAVIGGIGTIVGSLRGLVAGLNAKAEEQARLTRAFVEASAAFAKSIKDAGLSQVQRENSALAERLAEQIGNAASASGISGNPANLPTTQLTADGIRELQRQYFQLSQTLRGDAAKAARDFGMALNMVIENAEAAEAALRQQQQERFTQATDDVRVTILRAQGRTAEADAMQRQLDLQRKIADATNAFDGMEGLAEYIQLLKDADEAAAAAAAAEQARTRVAFGLDLTQRRQTLNGDERGAFITGQTIAGNSALAQAQQLVDAGTITAEMFEALAALLKDEFNDALADFDEAVRLAKQAVLDDLEIRKLVATGKANKAEALRVEIANRKELEGVTDEALRSQILYVQGLESTARAQASLAQEQRAITETLTDIDRRRYNAELDYLRALDPLKAEELESKQREVERAKELASATSAMVRTRLEELYAMEDAAMAQAKLADDMKRAADAAKDLANFSSDLETQWLRATGRPFDASVKELENWRETMRKNAAANGLANDATTQQRIDDIFNAKYAELIADTMGAADSAATARATEDGVRATTNFASVSETTALRMFDVQLSQLTVLREIAAKGGAGGSGITVQITVTGSPLVAQTPQQLGRDLAAQLVPALDEYQGRRIGVERRFVGNPVL